MATVRLLKQNKLLFGCNKSKYKSKHGVQAKFFSQDKSPKSAEMVATFSNG